MKRVEAELNEAGVLDLDEKSAESKPSKRAIADNAKGEAVASFVSMSKSPKAEEEWQDGDDDADDDDAEGEADIDYALLKNLLESFKGQSGASGPAGNLMGLMGMILPRDEGGSSTGNFKKPEM